MHERLTYLLVSIPLYNGCNARLLFRRDTNRAKKCWKVEHRAEKSLTFVVLVRITLNNSIMAYVINDDCIKCGTCVDECPSEAISEGDTKYVIDPAACVDCGTCADACPSEAIHPE